MTTVSKDSVIRLLIKGNQFKMSQRERIRVKTASIWRDAKYASVGIEFGISIAAGYFIGDWAQDKWDFAPWGVMIGVILGFTSGLRSLMRIATIESQRASTLAPIKEQIEQEVHHDQESRTESTELDQ